MPCLALIQTGGTIASRPNANAQGALTPQASAPEIGLHLPELSQFDVKLVQPFNLPSPHITPNHMLQLLQLSERLASEVDGIVITHGTDTLEETAYLLHLSWHSAVPLVLTGSMRHALEPSWDGPGNVWNAATVACDPRSRERGVLVVFAGDIFDARTVSKVHTTSTHAFDGYPGPIGRIDGPYLHFFAQPETCPAWPTPQHLNAHVEIIYAYAGWCGEGLAEALQRSDGLVIAALGTGNLPPAAVELLQQHRIPVILTTRAHAGPVLPLYGYIGGGQMLMAMGLIPASFVSPHKARIMLLVLLSLGKSLSDIRAAFGAQPI